jgi:hypothetical protein
MAKRAMTLPVKVVVKPVIFHVTMICSNANPRLTKKQRPIQPIPANKGLSMLRLEDICNQR